MCFEKLTKKLIKRIKWYDFSLIKLSTLFATLTLVSGWSAFREAVISVEWYWYLVAAIVVSIPILKKMFCKKN